MGTHDVHGKEVEANWGENGVAVIDDLMKYSGKEALPDPVPDETLSGYVQRCARSGLCHIQGDMHNLQDARSYLAADEKGIPCYELDALEPEFRGEHLRDLSPTERFTAYQREKNTLTGHVVAEEE